jgi:hypothetical protein
LRAASLSGGTLLAAPDLTIRPVTAAYTGRVTAVSYPDQTMTIDRRWPRALANLGSPVVVEVGVPGHRTTYMVRGVRPAWRHCVLTTLGGADFYLSRVQAVDPGKNRVHCAIDMPPAAVGNHRHWVASNDAMTKFWRADFVGKAGVDRAFAFDLSPIDGSAPRPGVAIVAESDFGRTRGFRLWEYGPGDDVRCATWVSLRRIAPGRFTVEGNADVEITVAGETHRLAVDALARDGGVIIEVRP